MRMLRTAVVFAVAVAGCSSEPATQAEAPKAPAAPAKPAVAIDAARLTAFAVLPSVMLAEGQTITDEQVTLGRMLYYETRMSGGKDVSCNSCHNLETYGVDNQPVSTGFKKQKGDRNSPTVYNAAGQFAQFWDGRAATVEDQALGPILNPVEHGASSAKAVEKTLKGIPEYVTAFKNAFPGEKDPVTFANVGKAIGAFERKLVTPSRWDKLLKGDETALTDEERKGFNTFVDTGCTVCHAQTYVGGTMYQKLGLVKPWPSQKDLGRYKVTKQAADKMFFKVPVLRNIEKTGPYFHDGSEPSLQNAVVMMARHQLGKELTPADAASIVTWMKTLTGDIDKAYIAQPAVASKK